MITERYALDGSVADQFGRDGHVVLRGVASAEEVESVRPAIQKGAATLRHETRPLEERDTYGRAFIQSCNIWQVAAMWLPGVEVGEPAASSINPVAGV